LITGFQTMPNLPNIQRDRWRVILTKPGASEIMVVPHGAACDLPEVRVPQNQRVARNLNAELKRDWKIDAISIVPAKRRSKAADSVRYHLAEPIRADAPLPRGLRWTAVASLTPHSFLIAEDFNVLRSFLQELSASPGDHGPFAHLGWFREVTSWLEEAILSSHFAWSGRFEQFHASPFFSLIRFDTRPRALWFKAVGEPNTHEFAITRELAERVPKYVPRLLAVRPDWNAWLAEECPGGTLDEVSDIALWTRAVRSLANLQVESISWSKSLLQAGARDLRGAFTRSAVESFFRMVEGLLGPMAEAVKLDFSVEDLQPMEARMTELLDRAGNLQVPDTLGHLDLNAGNVVVSSERCAYLDWAEAYVGPPFLALEYLLQTFRKIFGRGSPHERPVVEAYLAAWEAVTSPRDIREFWGLTPALAIFAYTQRCVAAVEPSGPDISRFGEYLGVLLRRLRRELGRQAERRSNRGDFHNDSTV
jgi:hypothetical protein